MNKILFDSTQLSLTPRGNCPICASDVTETYLPFQTIQVVLCKNCGFTYSDYVMSEESLRRYYEETFGGDCHFKGQKINALINTIACEKLIDFSAIQNCLDIGSGYGFFLESLQSKHNVEGTGLELSFEEVQYANEKLGVNSKCGLLSEADLATESFDLVTSFEVLEHVEKPIEFLKELSQFAKPGGLIVVMTDNFKSTAAELLGAEFPKWIPHIHISHFSPLTFDLCISCVDNLKIEKKISYTPWELLLKSWLIKVKGTKNPEDSYNLEKSLKSEMVRSYNLYHLRYILNPLWAKYTFSLDWSGALMYAVIRKSL